MSDTARELAGRIEAHVAARVGTSVQVRSLAPLAGGACQELWKVELSWPGGDDGEQLVLRSDAVRSLPGSIDRRAEFDVIGAARAAGVLTPRARWLGRDLVREGAWAYFLDWVDGVAIGRKVLGSPELAAARGGLVDEVAHSLARVHTVTPATHPGLVDGAPRGQSEGDPCEAALVFLREVLDRIDRPQPAFEYALRWLADHRPPPAPVTLVHGDYRTGNFMVAPDGLRGVLDWEFAHWSSPAEDLAWISVRDWRFGALDSPIGGFARREPFYEAYQRAGGRPVDRDEVRWWEVAGNVGWGSASVFQGQRYTSGEEDDYELIAIGRRPSEMAFEALRLVRQGR